jgi:hypothetical protein
MGANAQTAVPAFVAGEVLTAAEMTQVNTGIPVFATTTTRDAAFDGTGEKTLAQGQFAYIEASSTLQVYTGSAWVSATVPTSATVATSQTTTSATFTDLATAGPAVTLTTGTSALVIISSMIQTTTGNAVYAGFAVSGATTIAASTTSALKAYSAGGLLGTAQTLVCLVTLTAGSNTFTMKYGNVQGTETGTYNARTITVIPL